MVCRYFSACIILMWNTRPIYWENPLTGYVWQSIAVIHELRKIQMRSNREIAAVYSKTTIAPGVVDVAFCVARIGRADIHNRTEPCLALFFFCDVLKRTVGGGIVITLMIELADFHDMHRLSRRVRPYTNARAFANKTNIIWLPPFWAVLVLPLAISKKPEGIEPLRQKNFIFLLANFSANTHEVRKKRSFLGYRSRLRSHMVIQCS